MPSFRVSDWLERLTRDGFDGVELWENHYVKADTDEQAQLIEHSAGVGVFNTYAGFASSDDDAQARQTAADAIEQLDAPAVKYNLGPDASLIEEYRSNLLEWSAALPAKCQLLCECHPGTVLENLPDAVAFFDDLDPERFGIITHVSGNPDGAATWVQAFGSRVRHLHLQLRSAELNPMQPAGQRSLAACVAALEAQNYSGSATIEFTRGIGRDEQIQTLYANALADRIAFLEAWQ